MSEYAIFIIGAVTITAIFIASERIVWRVMGGKWRNPWSKQ
jgi:hypothetical protein